MEDWRGLQFEGLGPIDRVAAVFQIGPPLVRLPFPSFMVEVIERANGSFVAIMNVTALGPDGYADCQSGLGETVKEALKDVLQRVVRLLDERRPVVETDFVWSD